MTRRFFTAVTLATPAALCAQQPAEAAVPFSDFKAHLDIWMFEVRLNSYIPKRAIIEINPHTKGVVRANAHHYPTATRAALAEDITLLLAIKENPAIIALAKRKGIKVYRSSFGKDEWPVWLNLLDEMAKAQGQAVRPEAPTDQPKR